MAANPFLTVEIHCCVIMLVHSSDKFENAKFAEENSILFIFIIVDTHFLPLFFLINAMLYDIVFTVQQPLLCLFTTVNRLISLTATWGQCLPYKLHTCCLNLLDFISLFASQYI